VLFGVTFIPDPFACRSTRLLGAHRAPIHEACDGTDAVAACRAHCYHVIIMDIHMPTLNGFGHVPRDQIV